MTAPRKALTAAATLAVMVSLGGCPRPDPNPAVRVAGNREAAVPSTMPTTTTSTTVAPSTTYYYGPDGPGADVGK
ncbi:MAG: hypothetical protein R2698_11170 [Microthrixaceae bacterium]